MHYMLLGWYVLHIHVFFLHYFLFSFLMWLDANIMYANIQNNWSYGVLQNLLAPFVKNFFLNFGKINVNHLLGAVIVLPNIGHVSV